MKIKIPNYTFDASEKTITFTDYTTIRLDSVLLVTNVTDNITIYLFNDPALGGTVATNVLTLTYDTTAMADADKIQIFYDDGDINASTEEKQDDQILATQNISGMTVPVHDSQEIDETDPDNITITYKLNSVTVATKTIATSGAVTTITLT